MRLFVAATAAVPALAGQCSSQCSADTLQANIVNKGTRYVLFSENGFLEPKRRKLFSILQFSDDWSLECNTNKTPDVNDETTSRKKDVWNIICQGEKVTYPCLVQIKSFVVHKRLKPVKEVIKKRLKIDISFRLANFHIKSEKQQINV